VKERMRTNSGKTRVSYTLTHGLLAFIAETRQRRSLSTNSEALESLLHEAILEAKRREIDAACKEYYDTATEEELAEHLQWAEIVGPNILLVEPPDL